jgi:hypothetical protein
MVTCPETLIADGVLAVTLAAIGGHNAMKMQGRRKRCYTHQVIIIISIKR